MDNPDEARAAQQQPEDDPPPPYSERGAPPPLPPREPKNNPFFAAGRPGSSSQSQAGPSEPPVRPLPPLVNPSFRFPATVGMFYQKAVDAPTFNLGAEQDRPVCSVTFHNDPGFSTNPYLVLHATPNPASPALTYAERLSTHRSDFVLPAPKSFDGDGRTVTESLHSHASLTSVTHEFGVEVAGGGRERFEWRASKGREVRALLAETAGGGVSPPGRGRFKALGAKLVRLSAEADGVGGTRAVRDAGASSDGREVVAVWADCPRWRANRAGTLRFLGTAATGGLGERFQVLALASALRIWELENESSLQSAAVGSPTRGD